MKNFTLINDSNDFDNVVKTSRTIIGRLTKRRYNVLRSYAKRHIDNAPYGRSRNGYAYTCGCEHDCCGHLTGQYMEMDIKPSIKGHEVTLVFTQSYNF